MIYFSNSKKFLKHFIKTKPNLQINLALLLTSLDLKMQRIDDDELDLFTIIQLLWTGKWIIVAFTATAALAALSYGLLQTPRYQSKVVYTIDTLPPFYEKEKVLLDFEKMFYSKSVFENWAKNDTSNSIEHKSIDRTQLLEGFVFNNSNIKLVTLKVSDGIPFILIRSNQLNILNDFFNYATHINNRLSEQYVLRAEQELNLVQSRFRDSSSSHDSVISTLLSFDRYIFDVKNGANVFVIQRPDVPRKVSPRLGITITLSLILGFALGVISAIFRKFAVASLLSSK